MHVRHVLKECRRRCCYRRCCCGGQSRGRVQVWARGTRKASRECVKMQDVPANRTAAAEEDEEEGGRRKRGKRREEGGRRKGKFVSRLHVLQWLRVEERRNSRRTWRRRRVFEVQLCVQQSRCRKQALEKRSEWTHGVHGAQLWAYRVRRRKVFTR